MDTYKNFTYLLTHLYNFFFIYFIIMNVYESSCIYSYLADKKTYGKQLVVVVYSGRSDVSLCA